MDDRDWTTLISRIGRGKCTPFIGAGASAPLLPLGSQVAGEWAAEYGYPLADEHNLSRVAQYLAVKNDPMWPKETLADQLAGIGHPDFKTPGEPHGVLAALDLPIYLTTNYDDFMTAALAERGKKPEREVCRWNEYLRQSDELSVFDQDGFEPEADTPVVYHLHGRLDEPESMVLTEDDYLEFVVNISRFPDLLPSRIQRSLTGASLLFVGYSLEDWTFRVIFHGLVAPMESSLRRMSVAVQLPPDQKDAYAYLTEYLEWRNITVFWGSAQEFVAELESRMEAGADDG